MSRSRGLRVLFATPTPPVLMKPRPHHFIRGLAERGHEVHLLAEAASPAALRQLDGAPGWRRVAAACASVTWVVVPRARSFAQCLASLPTRAPLRVAYCRSPDLRDRARQLMAAHDIDLLHVDRGRFAPAFRDLPVPKVLDATDSISLYLRRSLRGGPLAERVLAAVELPKMPAFEREMAAGYSACLVSSDVDAAALRQVGMKLSPEVIGNGVEDRLLRADRRPEPQTLVFVGGMSYGPNVRGVTWFVRDVLPLVRRSHPRSRLLVVGHRPARAVRRLARVPGVEVTGTVADVGPYLYRAAAFVAPIRLGGGFSNKVVEALAAGAPIVATPEALEGVPGVESGVHLLTASGPERFAAAVNRLLDDPKGGEELGRRGRDLARQRYAWDGVVARLEDVYSRVVGGPI